MFGGTNGDAGSQRGGDVQVIGHRGGTPWSQRTERSQNSSRGRWGKVGRVRFMGTGHSSSTCDSEVTLLVLVHSGHIIAQCSMVDRF